MAAGSGARATGGGLEQDRNEFRRIVTSLNDQIDADGKDGRGALHKDAEAIYMRLLNALFGWELVDANPPGRSTKAIDLIDRKRRIVVQVTSDCSSRKISDETIAKMNAALESGEEVPYRGGQDGSYRLKFAFVGREDKTKRGGARERWGLERPRGFEFDRVADTIFTSDLTHAFKDLDPARRAEVLELVRGDVGRIGCGTPLQPVDADVVARINARLERQRKGHPSFKLMGGKPDDTLFPKGVQIPNIARTVRTEGDGIVSFRDFVRDSWAGGGQEHLIITGRGGVGKTVALLSFATEKGFLPRGVPAVYVPLYDLAQNADGGRECLDRYLEREFSETEYRAIQALSKEPWADGPNVILLMDGYNEVPANKQTNVTKGVCAWAERSGTQLVTTSRVPGLSGIHSLRRLELQSLSSEGVVKYLEVSGIKRPAKNRSRLLRMLETPLMLKIYVAVKELPEKLNAPYLTLKESDCAGNLVWNYLQRELWRVVDHNASNDDNAKRASAVLLTLPYVCWRMEEERQFRLSREELERYVWEASKYWGGAVGKPTSFKRIEVSLDSFVGDMSDGRFISSQLTLIANEAGLIAWNGNGYSILHQNLRAGLAAIHLKNVMETPFEQCPSEFNGSIPEQVSSLLAEMCEDRLLNVLWEKNRESLPTNAIATHNLLRVMYQKRDGDLKSVDWSGMDLRRVSLFPFRKDLRLKLSPDPRLFEGTILSVRCFVPRGHAAPVTSVCFNPKGSLIASGSLDNTIRMWDTATGRQVGDPLRGHGGGVQSVCFSPDGSILASGSGDRAVRLWNPTTGQQVGEPLRGHSGGVESVCFNKDGSVIASCSGDGTVRLWDPASGEGLGAIKRCGVHSVCFSPKSATIIAVGSSDGEVGLWDTKTGLRVGQPLRGDSEEVAAMCFGPDGMFIASGSDDGTVRLWELASDRRADKLMRGHSARVSSIHFSPDGERMATGSYDGTARLWDVSSGRQVGDAIVGHGDWVRSVRFSPDGSLLAIGSDDCAVRLWDVSSGRWVGSPLEGQSGWGVTVCFNSDGTRIASGSTDGTVRLWDASTGRQVGNPLLGHSRPVASVCFSPDGTRIASGSWDKSVCLWDLSEWPIVGDPLLGHDGGVESVCFSPDGTRIASGSTDGTVRLWDASTGRQVGKPLLGHSRPVVSVCFSPDGTRIASGSGDGTVRLWDPSCGCQVGGPNSAQIKERSSSSWVESVCFNSRGTLIASGSSDGTVRLWDVADGSRVHEIWCHGGGVRSLCFSPDDELIACGSGDGAVRLVEVANCRRIGQPLLGSRGGIHTVSFSPDGSIVVCGSGDGAIRLWDIHRYSHGNAAHAYSTETIKPLHDIVLSGLDFSKAIIEDESDKRILRQNGVTL